MEDNAYEEFASNTIGHLKDFLSARGLSCTGSKQQLVSRCFVAWESKTPLKFTEKQQLSRLQTEYDTRLKEANIDDPRSFKDEVWSSDVKNWPKVDLGQIFSFVLSRKEQDMDFVGHYKTQKAYSYYQSGFVDTIYFTSLNGTKVVKSRVSPSQSIRNEAHDVWIALNKRHEIVVSWCSCIAGLAQTCNHVIAVLYKVEYATNMGYNDPACTSIPCGWNNSTKKNVQPCRLSNLNLRKDNRSKISGATIEAVDVNFDFKLKYDPRREDQKSVSDADISNLYSSLHKVKPKAVLFTGFPTSKSTITSCPKSVVDAGEFFKGDGDSDIISFIDRLVLTNDQSIVIEQCTRGQSNNEVWLEQRKGRLTASILHEVSNKMEDIVKHKITKTTPLVAKVLGKSQSIDHVPAIKYGRANENTARNLFFALESQKHRNLKVEQCGLFVKSDRPYIAGSPDGIVSCNCCPKAVLEIKCSFTLADKSVQDGWKNLDYLNMNDKQILELNQKHPYYTQLQGQMAATGIKMGHFFVWSPKGSLQTIVNFDPMFWVHLQEKLSTFFKAYIVPYLLSAKQLCICPKCEKGCCEPDEINNPLENSVLCDCCELWYHWKCVGVKGNPSDDAWVCADCLMNAVDL